ncbi:MAG: helix-turn-helix transcriptional regulator [Pyrinomonadaceae bacterium]
MYRDDLIRAKLGEKNLTKGAFAALSGLNINTVTALCKGDIVSISTLKKAGAALGLSMQELFTPQPEAETEPELAASGKR